MRQALQAVSSFVAAALLFLTAAPVQAQTNLLDDYNRADDNSLGMTPTEPVTLQWSEKDEDAADEIRVEDNAAHFTSDGSGGVKSAVVDMSNLGDYPVPINSATRPVTWAFNVRAEHDELTGFDSGKTGVMFMLTGTSNDIDGSANAYAVIIGTPDNATNNNDPVQIVRFNGGYSGNGELNVVTGGTAGVDSDYRSVRVTYDPGTNEWSLYVAASGSGFPYSNPVNVPASDQVGNTTADSNGPTGDTSAKFLGPHYNHGNDPSVDVVFDDVYVTDPSGELPVEIAEFDATADGGSAALTWTTASETNNAGFAIQHEGPETAGWSKVGFVDGAGTTTEARRYRFETGALDAGTHRFRLKQVDTDGTTSLSEARRVTVSGRPGLAVRGPNPLRAGQRADVRLNVPSSQSVSVGLYNALGQRVRTLFSGRAAPSDPVRATLDTGELAPGIYFVRAEGASLSQTQRVTVVK